MLKILYNTTNQDWEREDGDADTDWKNIPDPSECVGKYVVIKYDNKPYLGIVEDSGQSNMFVQCMHRVGIKDNNCFFLAKDN
jgi:hypothetical protein